MLYIMRITLISNQGSEKRPNLRVLCSKMTCMLAEDRQAWIIQLSELIRARLISFCCTHGEEQGTMFIKGSIQKQEKSMGPYAVLNKTKCWKIKLTYELNKNKCKMYKHVVPSKFIVYFTDSIRNSTFTGKNWLAVPLARIINVQFFNANGREGTEK